MTDLQRLMGLARRLEGVCPDSAEAASAFLSALPPEYRLPKIASDGEGGVIFAWEGAHRELVMSVCGWTLYPVVDPTAGAKHLPDAHFDGKVIPHGIMGALNKCAKGTSP